MAIATVSRVRVLASLVSAGWGLMCGAACCADPKIALLGAMQSLFEASMYTFVFLWTPALSPGGQRLPHGMIFACFMMACMAGSTIAGRLLSDPKRHPIAHYMKACCDRSWPPTYFVLRPLAVMVLSSASIRWPHLMEG